MFEDLKPPMNPIIGHHWRYVIVHLDVNGLWYRNISMNITTILNRTSVYTHKPKRATEFNQEK